MKQKVIMLRGLPGSGKSFWARDFVSKNKTWARINKDDIRAMLGFEFNHGNEEFTCDTRNSLIEQALLGGRSVIVDDTNFNPVHEKDIRSLVDEIIMTGIDIEFEIKMFDTPIWDCIERDAKREKPVGAKVIWGMHNKYLADNKSKSEWSADGKIPAIIVDIDGTLSHMNNRSPYDYSKVGDDYVDIVIADIVRRYCKAGIEVIIVSGRKDECKSHTVRWLNDNKIPFSRLFMRRSGDEREDSVVKKEIYELYIKSTHKVFFVLDDRERVVRMWRSLGLKVLQCEYATF